jgi:CheY-like chemotaxis protein
MSDRIALVIDDDTDFQKRLAGLLSRLGVDASVVRGEEETLDLLRRRGSEVELLFIAVELPDKEGFALFSKVKNARRRVPVILATSTISGADLKLHEKLKIHAEGYLDKLSVTDEEILDLLGSIGLSPSTAGEEPSVPASEELAPSHSETESPSEDVPESPERPSAGALAPPRPTIEPWLAELLDPETAAILADIEEESPASVPERVTAEGEVSPERVAELEEDLRNLRSELEQTRRDAQSSPFSSDFVSLREVAGRKDNEIRGLQKSLARRGEQAGKIKEKLSEFAQKLLLAQKEQDRGREQVVDLKGELESVYLKLQRFVGEVESLERRHEQEERALREALAAEQTRHVDSRRDLEAELATLKVAHQRLVQSREEEHQKELDEREAKWREEKTHLADELKAKYSEKLKEQTANHNRDVATLRQGQEKEIGDLHASHREASTRAATEAQEALQKAVEKSAQALKAADEQRLAELSLAENMRKRDLVEAERRFRERFEAETKKHRAEKEALTRGSESAAARIDRISSEFGAKVQDVAKNLEEERQRHQETRERYEREVATLQSTHAKHLEQTEEDQFSALAGLSRKYREERTRILDAERKKWEETAQNLHHDHTAALEGLEKQYADEAAALKAAQEAALRQRDAEGEQVRRLEVERVRAQMQEELDRLRRQQADEIAKLRQEQEKEVGSLQASHMEALQKRDRETHQSLREALETAKADAKERYEKALADSGDALATQRKEYEEEIATLERAHQQAITKREQEAREALRRIEEERDQATVASDALRAELTEMESKHRSAFSLTEERHKVELRDLGKELRSTIEKLEEEKQFLSSSVEKLKRQSSAEITRAVDALAHEKKHHQSSQDRYERRLAELNNRHSEGIKQIEQDWMRKLELLDKSFQEKHDKAIAALEADWKARLEKERYGQDEAERAVTRELEMELATVRQQLERTRGLEETYQAAARELTAAKARVEELVASIAEAHGEIAERDGALQDQLRRLAENRKTIDSLKAVIDDFSRSVQGYMRDREESDQTINSLKAVIDDFNRSIEAEGGEDPPERRN